jgi:hypothetical protein
MADTNQKCAHAGCGCSVGAGQTYCGPSCQQQAQQSSSGQQGQQGASSQAGARCNCGHAACQRG